MTKKQINQMSLKTAMHIIKIAGDPSGICMKTTDAEIKSQARQIVKDAKKQKVQFNINP